MKIALIGGGNIGRFLLQSINKDCLIPNAKIIGLHTRCLEKAKDLSREFKTEIFSDVESLLKSDADLVIEAATVEAVEEYAASILLSGKDLVLSSVGALADREFYHCLEEICLLNHTKIHLPSGAIGGLDVLKAAKSIGELKSVSIITRKPPHALPGAPLDEEKVLFEGSAAEAIRLFPRNINVSIILSLAGLGAENTGVKIISDPAVMKNSHTIEAAGSFGKLSLQVENDPMPDNPKTSYLAALSILASLKNREEIIRVG
ncbi:MULTISPECIES: aspartate dehydrogenase [unclassified Cytobacillus]|uniref:aspartate dehydrogenase n=1 Tax=unclassified Cytobacillus TaxID=2675268 RepID=UPI00203A53F7|nr:aspartate dehydrogenase [Cytobacillus sp. AMY 15.2]MCM3092798.1 aspartate dehydrogenase [Cytobacillus sp. AMY 15.2]